MDIADLNLSVRAFNAVCRAGIKTIPELYEKYQLDLEQLSREIGPNHTKEVGDALTKHREEVWEELRKEDDDFRQPKAGDYLCDYDPEIWGEAVTFDELTQMVGKLVIVNTAWYPDDTLEEDGEGDVLRVQDVDDDVIHLAGDTPKRHEITRQAMDDHVHCRYCTKVWKVKGEDHMIAFTTKLPPAPAEATTPEYLAAFNLNARIHCCKDNVERGLAEMCVLIEQMHSEKQYKQLGYQNFEEYCQQEFGFSREQGRKYTNVGKMLKGENANSSWHFDTIGINKLHLLSELDEPTREAVQESVDVESVTVKELREQIAKLEADKDAKMKQFQAAMESKDAEISEVRSGWKRRSDTLIEKIGTLQQRITELEERPVEHDVVDNTEELEALRQERDAANAALADAQKRLAERPMVQDALPVTDTTDAFKAYLSAAADAMRRLLEFVAKRPNDVNHALYLSRIDDVLNLSNTELAKLKGES